MNATQVKHAIARVDAILKQRLAALDRAEDEKAKASWDTIRERLRLGVLPFKKGLDWSDVRPNSDIADVFAVPKRARPTHRYETTPEAAALRQQAERLKDKIVLGDEAAALKALEDFANA